MITIEFLPNVRIILEHIISAEQFEPTMLSSGKKMVRLTLSNGQEYDLPDYDFKKMDEVVGKRLREITIQQNTKMVQL